MLSIGSALESTSTENITLLNSSCVIGVNLGSRIEADTAFAIISLSSDSHIGDNVPMQPRNFPALVLIETKQDLCSLQSDEEITSSPL